jgi:hypothetical protein
MWYLIFPSTIVLLLLSGCTSIFPENTTGTQRDPESVERSDGRDISRTRARPYAYSGTLKRYDPSPWVLPFFRPNYDYCIADEKGNTMAFLDISGLATGASMASFIDKTVIVNGQTSPHRYRGVIIIKAKHIILTTHKKN